MKRTLDKRIRWGASHDRLGIHIGTALILLGIAGGGSLIVSETDHGHDVPAAASSRFDRRGGEFPVTNANSEVVTKGVQWLIDAQQENGGWGAGSAANQQLRDPHAVQVDPGTTAFAAMALLRAGYDPLKGTYHKEIRKALDYLIELVENYPENGPQISDVTGTQPQRKLGQYVDVSLCAQFFGRAIPLLDADKELKARTEKVLDKCIHKIEAAQKDDGSWNHGGWAPVLQSAMANNALESGKKAGRAVDDSVMVRSLRYQKSNYDGSTGTVRKDAAAGVELYANSSSQRTVANEAKQAIDAIDRAKRDNTIPKGTEVSYDALVKAGVSKKDADNWSQSYQQYNAAVEKLEDERMLAGFGNNGGEEFLSYMLTSESLVVTGGKEWESWNDKMHTRLAKVQNTDGSWSGHHCITSPVFCTAAALLCLNADRDTDLLRMEQAKKKDASGSTAR